MIMSHQHFMWIVSVFVIATAINQTVRDGARLRRTLPRRKESLERRDEVFGYLIGLTIVVIAVTGVLRYHLR